MIKLRFSVLPDKYFTSLAMSWTYYSPFGPHFNCTCPQIPRPGRQRMCTADVPSWLKVTGWPCVLLPCPDVKQQAFVQAEGFQAEPPLLHSGWADIHSRQICEWHVMIWWGGGDENELCSVADAPRERTTKLLNKQIQRSASFFPLSPSLLITRNWSMATVCLAFLKKSF